MWTFFSIREFIKNRKFLKNQKKNLSYYFEIMRSLTQKIVWIPNMIEFFENLKYFFKRD
jgi:hypothetical protein